MSLKFRDSSRIFEVQVINSRGLKIGLSAYRSYVEKRLADTYSLVDSLFNNGEQTIDDDDVMMSIPVYYEGNNYIAEVMLNAARRVVNGIDDVASAFRIGEHGTDETAISINADDINKYLSDRITSLQGQSLIFSAALKQDINSAFNMTQIQSEMTLLGYETSEYLQNILSSVTDGMTWSDILHTIAGAVSSPSKDDISGYWSFNADDYTGVSSIALGITTIGNTVASFFNKISFDITKIDQFFKSLVEGIGDLITWLFQMIAGDVLSDYVVMDNYSLEAFDIPIASVTFDLDDSSSLSTMAGYISTISSDPNRKYCMKGILSAANNAYDQTTYNIGYLPDYNAWDSILQNQLQDGSQVVLPWQSGFIMLTRNGKTVSCYYFIGDFKSPVGYTTWSASSDGTINFLNAPVSYRSLSSTEFKSNSQFVDWFKGLFDSTYSDWRIPISYNFVGTGTSVVEWFPCYYNLSSIDTPASVIDACDQFYYTGITNDIAAQLLLNALVWMDVSKSDSPHGSACVMLTGQSTPIYSEAFSNESIFLPYHENVYPSFKYHAQTDAERTADILTLFKRIALTAAAIGVAAVSVKLRKNIKVKAYQSEVQARDAWRAVESADPDSTDMPQLIKSAYKTQKRANRWNSLASLIGGKTVNSKLSQTMTNFSTSTSEDDSTEFIYSAITGRRI